MKKYILIILLNILPLGKAWLGFCANPDSLYLKGNYHGAIEGYQNELKKGVSAELYYNLGNAYFRANELPQAILSYERAYKLSPGDEDIRFNLQFARSRTVDKVTPESEVFFVTWWHQLVNMTSSNNWAHWAVALFLLTLLLTGCYLFAENLQVIRVGFYGGCLTFLLFLFAMLISWQQKQVAENHDGAIITQQKVDVKKTPSASSAVVMTLHEGTRVDIKDRSMKGWLQVHLADGREGWLSPKSLEEI